MKTGLQLDTPMVAGLLTLGALAVLILVGRGFSGVSINVG
jgi:hypothetical protein